MWQPYSQGLQRLDDRWGLQRISASPCRKTPGNVFITFASGHGPTYRYLQFSLNHAEIDHLVNCLDVAIDDAKVDVGAATAEAGQ